MPENEENSQFVVKTVTPIGGNTVSHHGSKEAAVNAAIQHGKRYMTKLFSKIAGV
jgi:hypothetical protein